MTSLSEIAKTAKAAAIAAGAGTFMFSFMLTESMGSLTGYNKPVKPQTLQESIQETQRQGWPSAAGYLAYQTYRLHIYLHNRRVENVER